LDVRKYGMALALNWAPMVPSGLSCGGLTRKFCPNNQENLMNHAKLHKPVLFLASILASSMFVAEASASITANQIETAGKNLRPKLQ
jgi:hypothetical protein